MIQKTFIDTSAAVALLESDAFYFELAAERIDLEACQIAFVRDLITLPVCCVVQRVNRDLACRNPSDFLEEVEATCRRLGAPLVRMYLHGPSDELESELVSRGFQGKTEIGYVTTPSVTCDRSNQVQLHQVVSHRDWQTKLDVHRCEDIGSDGYCNQAADWNQLMHRKNETGLKTSYLIQDRDKVAGTIAMVEAPGMRRVKNLFILPAYRRLGLAVAAVNCLLQAAAEHSIATAGVFGIEGSAGCAVYENCGFVEVTRQIEYTKRIVGNETRPMRKHPR